jgi:hypothetical protein
MALDVRRLASSPPRLLPKCPIGGDRGMEVDRIWRIGGVDDNANPAWQDSARRRRKFVEEVAVEDESEAGERESAAQDQSPEQDRQGIAVSENTDSPAASADSDVTFRVIA